MIWTMMNGSGQQHHQQHQQQRRTFRGRGGPTDGRLPKHGFHPKRPAQKSTRSYDGDNDDADNENNNVDNTSDVTVATALPVAAVAAEPFLTSNKQDKDENEVPSAVAAALENDKCSHVECENDDVESSSSSSRKDDPTAHTTDAMMPFNTVTTTAIASPSASSSSSSPPSLLGSSNSSSSSSKKKKQEEVMHLLRRIRQNREAWSLSAVALARPETYRINVLQATRNCVNEYKSILKYHYNCQQQQIHSAEHAVQVERSGDNDDADDIKAMSLAIFELIQHALQCGPLAGGKAGYFKRCGSPVATMVHAWLVDLCASGPDEAMLVLRLTEKQALAMEKWKAQGLRAAENTNKHTPSKTVLKNQDAAAKKNKAKKNETEATRRR
jgi:hypothetical protein